ncbi:MAG: hypothetical protein J5501_03680 [Ruminococcus sp.]|nr:hypothetical protein [Ruminococcus sp.]
MKKRICLICLAAVMLTGCGSTAPQNNTSDNAAGNSAGADAQGSPADEKKDENAEEEIVYRDRTDIHLSIPRPASLKQKPYTNDIVYVTETLWDEDFVNGKRVYDKNEVVFFQDLLFYNKDNIECKLDTLLEDQFLKKIDNALYDYYEKNACEDISRYTIDENTEEDLAGTPARRISGTIKTGYDSDGEYLDVHFIAHLCIPETNHPFMTFTCTASNNKDKLDTMTHIADMIITKVKKYEP